jgi:uncharacterized Fe-S cluster protein YjdI
MGWLFDDEYQAADKNRQYTNGEITVFWQSSKCIHATYCYKELIEVFNPRNRPWVDMNGAPTEQIIETVDKCPTEALTWRWNDPEKNKISNDIKVKQALRIEQNQNNQNATTTIQVVKDGPLLIKDNYKIIGKDGDELKIMPITSLCRCGATKKAPFCDGNHLKIGFKD